MSQYPSFPTWSYQLRLPSHGSLAPAVMRAQMGLSENQDSLVYCRAMVIWAVKRQPIMSRYRDVSRSERSRIHERDHCSVK